MDCGDTVFTNLVVNISHCTWPAPLVAATPITNLSVVPIRLGPLFTSALNVRNLTVSGLWHPGVFGLFTLRAILVDTTIVVDTILFTPHCVIYGPMVNLFNNTISLPSWIGTPRASNSVLQLSRMGPPLIAALTMAMFTLTDVFNFSILIQHVEVQLSYSPMYATDRMGTVLFFVDSIRDLSIAMKRYRLTTLSEESFSNYVTVSLESPNVDPNSMNNIAVTVVDSFINATGASIAGGVLRMGKQFWGEARNVTIVTRNSSFVLSAVLYTITAFRDVNLMSLSNVTLVASTVIVSDVSFNGTVQSGSLIPNNIPPKVMALAIVNFIDVIDTVIELHRVDQRCTVIGIPIPPDSGTVTAWAFGVLVSVVGSMLRTRVLVDACILVGDVTLVRSLDATIIFAFATAGVTALYISGNVTQTTLSMIDSAVVNTNTSMVHFVDAAFIPGGSIVGASILSTFSDALMSSVAGVPFANTTMFDLCNITVRNMSVWHSFDLNDTCAAAQDLYEATAGFRILATMMSVLVLPTYLFNTTMHVDGLWWWNPVTSSAASGHSMVPPSAGAACGRKPEYSFLGCFDFCQLANSSFVLIGSGDLDSWTTDTSFRRPAALQWIVIAYGLLQLSSTTIRVSNLTVVSADRRTSSNSCPPNGVALSYFRTTPSLWIAGANVSLGVLHSSWYGYDALLPSFAAHAAQHRMTLSLSCTNVVCTGSACGTGAGGGSCGAAEVPLMLPTNALSRAVEDRRYIRHEWASDDSCSMSTQIAADKAWDATTSSRTITMPPLPPPTPPPPPYEAPAVVQVSHAVATATVAVRSLVASSGAFHAQRGMLSLRLAACKRDGQDGASQDLAIADSPTQLELGGSPLQGAVVGNVLVVLAVTALMLLIGVVIQQVTKRNNHWKGALRAGIEWCGLPGSAIGVFSNLLQPTFGVALALLLVPQDAGDVVVGILGVLICAAPIAFLVWRLVPAHRFKDCRARVVPLPRNSPADATCGAAQRLLERFVHRRVAWESTSSASKSISTIGLSDEDDTLQMTQQTMSASFEMQHMMRFSFAIAHLHEVQRHAEDAIFQRGTVEAYGAVFGEYHADRPYVRHFYVFELFIALYSGVLMAMDVSQVATCDDLIYAGVAGSILFAVLAISVVMNPYSSYIMNVNLHANNLLTLLSLALAAGDEAEAAEAMAMLQLAILVVITGIDAYASIASAFHWLRRVVWGVTVPQKRANDDSPMVPLHDTSKTDPIASPAESKEVVESRSSRRRARQLINLEKLLTMICNRQQRRRSKRRVSIMV